MTDNKPEALQRNTPYALASPLTHGERARLGLTPYDDRNIMAIWTGEKRAPRAGEWYLSGAIIEAYRAPNDLPTAYHIARLVKVERRTEVVIMEEDA